MGLAVGIGALFVFARASDLQGTEGDGVSPDDSGYGVDDLYADTIGAIVVATSSQTVSSTGIALIQSKEGCRLTAYPDVTGWSIGWGHYGVSRGDTCTQAQADAWLIADAQNAATTVLRYCRVPLNQNQLDALTDWMYEFGASKTRSATLWSVLNAGNYDQVPAQLMRWVKKLVNGVETVDPSIVARRQAECDLWNTPADTDANGYGGSTSDLDNTAYLVNPGSADDGSEADFGA